MRVTAARPRGENPARVSARTVAREASAGAASPLEHGADRPEAAALERLSGLANRSAQARITAGYQRLLNGGAVVQRATKGAEMPGLKEDSDGDERLEEARANAPTRPATVVPATDGKRRATG